MKSQFEVSVLEVGFGNLPSIKRVLKQIDANVNTITTAKDLEKAEFLIISGVGSFSTGIDYLHKTDLYRYLIKRTFELDLPTLGICLGAQIMFELGTEGGQKSGLGIFEGKVESLKNKLNINKTHTGWDQVKFNKNFLGFSKSQFYDAFFNHDYYFSPKNKEDIYGICNYEKNIPVAIKKNNIYGVQFHPEKSQKFGLLLLKNFLNIKNV